MSRHRRAVLLAGLALVLGGLAASDVTARDASLRRRMGPPEPVVVAGRDLRPGDPLDVRHLAIRMVPRAYVPRDHYTSVLTLTGRTAAVPVARGTDVSSALVATMAPGGGAPVAAGERVAEIVAEGSRRLIVAGGRVDVLVTRETGQGQGHTTLALQDAEVLAVSGHRSSPEQEMRPHASRSPSA